MFACLFVCFFPHRQENLLSFVSWCKSGANQSCKALKNLKIMCKLRPTGIFTTVLYFFPNEKFMNNISIVVKIIILTSSEIRSAIGHIAAMATVSFGIASFNRLIPFKYNVIKKLQMNAVIYLWFEIHMKWTLNAAPVTISTSFAINPDGIWPFFFWIGDTLPNDMSTACFLAVD